MSTHCASCLCLTMPIDAGAVTCQRRRVEKCQVHWAECHPCLAGPNTPCLGGPNTAIHFFRRRRPVALPKTEHYLSSSRKNINFPDIMFELEKKKNTFCVVVSLQSFVHCDLIASTPRVSKTFETGIWCKLTFMDPVRWMVKDCGARCRHHRRRRRIASRRTS